MTRHVQYIYNHLYFLYIFLSSPDIWCVSTLPCKLSKKNCFSVRTCVIFQNSRCVTMSRIGKAFSNVSTLCIYMTLNEAIKEIDNANNKHNSAETIIRLCFLCFYEMFDCNCAIILAKISIECYFFHEVKNFSKKCIVYLHYKV